MLFDSNSCFLKSCSIVADHRDIVSLEKVWLELPLERLVPFYSLTVRYSKAGQGRRKVHG